MTRYTLRRLAGLAPVLLVASLLVWLMVYLVPGDPVLTRLGPDATPIQIAAEREALGLDRPVLVQYVYWFRAALQGDFGRSTANGEQVTALIGRAFPVTVMLTVSGLLLAASIGLTFGIAVALRPDGMMAKAVNAYSSLALGIPTFWVGMLLVWFFALYLRVLPPSGYVSPLSDPQEYVRHMILPVVTLAFYGSGILARFVAAAMSEAIAQDYVWTARAKGLSGTTVMRRHGLRNALIPVTTVLGLQFSLLLGGAVVIEAVFNVPGMGRLLLDSVARRDYAVVQAEILFLLIAVAVINILVDVLYAVVDPRIRR